MAYDFENYYSADPWENITLNEREWYDPVLRDHYRRDSVYSQYTMMRVDMNGPRARTIHFNDLITPRPNIAPIGNRQMEATRLHTDSYQKQVTTRRYGNGMALHKEDEMFSYWQNSGGGTGFGLRPIIDASMGQLIVDHLDLLARNAYFRHPYVQFGNGSATGVDGIGVDDRASTDLLDGIWLSTRDRKRVAAPMNVGYATGSEILCITTSGFVYDLKREVKNTGYDGTSLGFVDAHIYANSLPLITGEIGMYRGVRFIDNGMAKLWNIGDPAGDGAAQTAIKSAVVPGQGAPGNTEFVEGVRRVGQPDAVHYIEVQDASDFNNGDVITIHKLRATSQNVIDYAGKAALNGVLFDDPMAQDVEIHSVDTDSTPHRISLKEPYMMTQENGKGLETDLGGTVFGYVTKAHTVHTALFLNPYAGISPLVAGVAQPPRLYTPPAIDDYLSMYRITYDFWADYAVWEPRVFSVWMGTGANAIFGRPFHGLQ